MAVLVMGMMLGAAGALYGVVILAGLYGAAQEHRTREERGTDE